jgi:two-component system, cell cycle response regulator
MGKLLILDDTAGQLKFLQYFLETKQYVVKTLNNTLDLFSEIYKFKPDLLLLSAFSGGIDRRDLCKQLRDRPETRHLGILIFSADENFADYKSYYADDFIQKPLNLNILSDKIRSLLSWIPIRKKAIGNAGNNPDV